MKPNALAWIALYGWPLVALAAFATLRSTTRLARTTAWMMILPVMFLPARLELPFAGLNKHRLAFLSIAAALVLFHRRELAIKERWRHFPLLLLIVFALGTLLTIRTNADALSFGVLRIPGLGPRDGVWITYAFLVDLILPFAIGQRVFRTERDLRDLLVVLSTCTLVYAPLCLLEMRLSPQLSNWVYGYFPHTFAQTLRGAGYRPVVFMNHGLSVAMFLFSGACAALALHRAPTRSRPSSKIRVLVPMALLLLGRSLASIIYAVVALVASLWASRTTQKRLVAVLACLVVAYPVLRAYDVVPLTEVGEAFARINPDRSASLMFRFKQEEKLLERAMLRPLFGWGNWGRSRIYHSWGKRGDEWAGYKDVSVTDGTWIIWLGTSGLVGFAVSLALLVAPLLRYVRNRQRLHASSHALLTGLALMVALFTIDLLPNSQSDFLLMAYAGALFTLSAMPARAEVQRARPRAESGVSDGIRAETTR